MIEMKTLDDLIVDLKSLTAPDRVLDAYIWAAIHCPDQPIVVVGPPTYTSTRYFCKPDAATDWIGYDLLSVAPHYTSSLDAALTLRPEGANCWGVEVVRLHPLVTFDAYCSRNFVNDGHWFNEANHTSPAIALCIAALRARKEVS